MSAIFPVKVYNRRPLPRLYRGPAMVWDIDKTYLETRFSSLRGLFRIPFELAVDKKVIPGMPEVLRGLRRGPGKKVKCVPLYFISASPPILRRVLEHKMLLDGVEQDGITFKHWFRTLIQFRPGRLWEQLGFKLYALFLGRFQRLHATEYLFGDDAERDAEAYWLYARVLHGKLDLNTLEKIMAKNGVPEDDRLQVRELAGSLPRHKGKVGKIFIHLEKDSSPKLFSKLGRLVIPVRGAFQMALALYGNRLIDATAVHEVKHALEKIKDNSNGKISSLVRDALNRKIISERDRQLLKIKTP